MRYYRIKRFVENTTGYDDNPRKETEEERIECVFVSDFQVVIVWIKRLNSFELLTRAREF